MSDTSALLSRAPAPGTNPAAAYPLALDLVRKIDEQLLGGSQRYRSKATGVSFRRLWDVVNACLLNDLVIFPPVRTAGEQGSGGAEEKITHAKRALRSTE